MEVVDRDKEMADRAEEIHSLLVKKRKAGPSTPDRELALIQQRQVRRRKHAVTYREDFCEKKRDFEAFLSQLLSRENEDALHYLVQVRETSLEDWAFQFVKYLGPLVRFGSERLVMTRILTYCSLEEKDLYFQGKGKKDPSARAPEDLKKEAAQNYLLFLEYVRFFSRECSSLGKQ